MLIIERDTVIAGTKEGAAKGLKTKRDIYGENAQKEWGKKGGQARSNSPNKHYPFKDDPKFASEMGKKSAQKRWGVRDTMVKPSADYVHVCKPCDKCTGCSLECEHKPTSTTTFDATGTPTSIKSTD